MKRGDSGINLLLGIDKPSGMSSHDVVNRVRRALGERRVGHAGTLDPAATGVLVVGVGQGTRCMGYLTTNTKSYLASIAFGAETNTDDGEGEITRTAGIPEELCDESFARETLEGLCGRQMQVPPAFSAISVDGKRAYARARSGEDVVLEPREVEVFSSTLIGITSGEGVLTWECAFTVSKGTYIRSMARDLGRSLGSAAHLSRLCRTASGSITLPQCVSLERLEELGARGASAVALDPVPALGYVRHDVSRAELNDVRSGRSVAAPANVRPGALVTMVYDGRVIGIWECERTTLRSRANFPQGIEGVRA